MKSKWTISMVMVIILITVAVFLVGFTKNQNKTPKNGYQVYLDGKLLGTIASEEKFNDYINQEQIKIKQDYGVEKVYAPKGVEIKKVVTYQKNFNSEEYIYEKLKKLKPFTIKGTIVKVEYDNESIVNSQEEDFGGHGQEGKKDPIEINVLNKEIFDQALERTIKAFVKEDDYKKYISSTQEEIVDTGSIIEDIDTQEKITYREDLLSTSDQIFTDIDTLTKYLMYGTTEKQAVYIVKEGNTIAEVAEANKLNVQEFLIANPEFTSENNLLYANQEVSIGLINPLINIIVTYHTVAEEEKKYDTEEQIDEEKNIGYLEELRAGENGSYLVTSKNQYINGQLVDSVTMSVVETKPSINRIIVKGSKVIPNVADLSYWAWPTNKPYRITSGYAYRWGSFHGAIDISGTGYGSPIYAANNGTVYRVGYKATTNGNYVVIKHNINNYYTAYLHMKKVYVKEGQTVSRGQQIGEMGNTGFVSPKPTAARPTAGTHLHFAVYIGPAYEGGYHINPWRLYQ